MPIPGLEGLANIFAGARAFCTLGLVQGYWQMPLGPDSQLLFTIFIITGYSLLPLCPKVSVKPRRISGE